ncbi:hypothetical protein MKX03_017607 [Papaver bracteatum]|nr:hypothetical protein MKX03_004512 [Papaver bracteatum]KAI3866502.1 hypothetical protein MKX03_017607 [Papaver bracteatum]
MDKPVNQNILSRTGKDSYSISKVKKCNEEIVLKEEMGVQVNQVGEKVQRGSDEDYLYMKALYHVLPLAYVTISELQSKLEGEADQALVRKLLKKMTCDGYVEDGSNPELGNRVVRSEFTVKKLIESMEIFEPQNISTCACGGLCCVGSDLTRTLEISVDPHLNESSTIQEQLGNNTRLCRNETAASRENAIPWSNKRNGVDGRGFTKYVEHDETSCSCLSQEKHTSKTSTVEEPIHQNMKLCNKVSEIGHGTTGFAFINPERIIMCADGKVRGKKWAFHFVCPRVSCKRRRINRRRRMSGYWKYGWVPYVRLNSRKLFVVGNYPNEILISCAGLTYWFKKIVDDLKLRVKNDEMILTPEICAGIASETMDVDTNYVDENLRPDAPSIHEAYAEMFFGGFIGEGPQRRLSLFLCIKNQFGEVIESSRVPEFTEDELKNMGVSFMGIGSGGETASGVLAGHEAELNQVGLPGAYYTNRVLHAMQAAIDEDEDSGGKVTVAQMTQEDVQIEHFNYDGYPPIPIF